MKTYKLYIERTTKVYLDVYVEANSEKEALNLAKQNAKNGEYTTKFQAEEHDGNFEDEFRSEFYYKTDSQCKRAHMEERNLNLVCGTCQKYLHIGEYDHTSCITKS